MNIRWLLRRVFVNLILSQKLDQSFFIFLSSIPFIDIQTIQKLKMHLISWLQSRKVFIDLLIISFHKKKITVTRSILFIFIDNQIPWLKYKLFRSYKYNARSLNSRTSYIYPIDDRIQIGGTINFNTLVAKQTQI